MGTIPNWPEWAVALAALGLIALPAMAMAWLMRSARLFGGAAAACAVVGGILAGVLAGPGALGRVAPDAYEALFTGATVEREARQRLAQRQAIEIAVLQSADVTPAAVAELRARHEAVLAGPRAAELRALERRADTIGAVGLGVAALTLIVPYFLRLADASRRPMPEADRIRSRAAGTLGALFAGALGAGALALLLGTDWRAALAFGGAVGAGWATPGLRARRTGRFGRDLRTDQASGAALGVGMLAGAGAAASALLAIGALPALIGLRRMRKKRSKRGARRTLHGVVYAALAPSACAAAAMRVDPYALFSAADSAFWIAFAVGVIASSDGRWCSAAAGWLLVGRAGLDESMERATAQIAAGVGVAQCSLTLALSAMGVLSGPLTLSLLAGALTAECAVGAYRLFTRKAEEALRHASDA